MQRFILFSTLFLVLCGLISLDAVLTYESGYPLTLGPNLGGVETRQVFRQEIEEAGAEMVLLGDSVLRDSVDGELFGSLIGMRAHKISQGGSASAFWYLALKNNIIYAEPKPEHLVVFFRDTMLTSPGLRVTGNYSVVIDEFAGEEDTLLVQLAYINQMHPMEQFAGKYLPVFGERLKLRESLENRLKNTVPGFLLDCQGECVQTAIDTVFEEEQLDLEESDKVIVRAEDYLYRLEEMRFEKRLGESFLPEIMRIAREAGIRLSFVRTKTWRYPELEDEPPALQRYHRELASYLAENDVVLLDFAHDARITRDMYKDDIHMSLEGRAAFTPMLAEAFLERVVE
jgi:hypothetical protein